MSKRKQGDAPTVGLAVYDLQVSIIVSLNHLSYKNYMNIKEKLAEGIYDWDKGELTLKQLDDILMLQNRKYHPTSISFPEMTHERFNNVHKGTTEIEIRG